MGSQNKSFSKVSKQFSHLPLIAAVPLCVLKDSDMVSHNCEVTIEADLLLSVGMLDKKWFPGMDKQCTAGSTSPQYAIKYKSKPVDVKTLCSAHSGNKQGNFTVTR